MKIKYQIKIEDPIKVKPSWFKFMYVIVSNTPLAFSNGSSITILTLKSKICELWELIIFGSLLKPKLKELYYKNSSLFLILSIMDGKWVRYIFSWLIVIFGIIFVACIPWIIKIIWDKMGAPDPRTVELKKQFELDQRKALSRQLLLTDFSGKTKVDLKLEIFPKFNLYKPKIILWRQCLFSLEEFKIKLNQTILDHIYCYKFKNNFDKYLGNYDDQIKFRNELWINNGLEAIEKKYIEAELVPLTSKFMIQEIFSPWVYDHRDRKKYVLSCFVIGYFDSMNVFIGVQSLGGWYKVLGVKVAFYEKIDPQVFVQGGVKGRKSIFRLFKRFNNYMR